jgi:hypothetical protein
MTSAKKMGRIILWALRLGLFFLGPIFLWLTCLALFGPFRPVLFVAGMITLALTAGAAYIGWRCNLAFPGERPQSDHPNLARWGMALAAGSGGALAINLGLAWIHSAAVATHSDRGATVFFVREDILIGFILFALLLSAIGFLLWLISLLKNARQLRLLSWLTVLIIGIYPVTVSVTGLIDAHKGQPLWEIQQTATGPDQQTYYFLREGGVKNERTRRRQFQSPETASAIARRTGNDPFLVKAEIILSDVQSQNPHGALLQGLKHDDLTVRQVSEKLLKEGEG